MAFHDHEMSFESFTDHHHHHHQQHHHQHQQQQRLSGAVVDVSSGGGGSGAPTWLSNAILRQQSSNNNNNNSSSSVLHDGNDDVHAGSTNHRGGGGGGDRNRTESEDCEREERWEWESAKHKGDIVTHPLYEQLLSAHVACLRIATPVDQLPKIDAQLEQSQRVVAKYSVLGNGAVDQKELDQFMVSSVFLSVICLVNLFLVIAVLKKNKVDFFFWSLFLCCLGFYVSLFFMFMVCGLCF